jgi:hypothetical protein
MRETGDVVTTKTGKVRVITGVSLPCPPEEFDARMERFEAGRGVKPVAHVVYDTRALRNGKPYGSTRTYREEGLRESAEKEGS